MWVKHFGSLRVDLSWLSKPLSCLSEWNVSAGLVVGSTLLADMLGISYIHMFSFSWMPAEENEIQQFCFTEMGYM